MKIIRARAISNTVPVHDDNKRSSLPSGCMLWIQAAYREGRCSSALQCKVNTPYPYSPIFCHLSPFTRKQGSAKAEVGEVFGARNG